MECQDGGQRAGLGLAIAHHHRDQQLRIVEGGAEGVREAVAELTALVDGARGLRRAMAADAAGERELLEELEHPLDVLALVRKDLGVGPLEIDGPQHPGRSVPGTGQEDRVQVVLVDQPIEVDVGKAQPGTRAPVAQQALLDVLRLERLAEQGIALQVDHADREVVARPPVRVDLAQLVGGQAVR